MFKVNEEFAKNYNAYRQKEEFQKLKARYGDVKLKQSDSDPTHPSSSSSEDESSDSDSSWADKEQEDFLVLYDALCRNDPALNDSTRNWFRDPSNDESDDQSTKESDPNTNSTLPQGDAADQQAYQVKSHKALKLRDYEREFLIEQGGVEDETMAVEANRIAATESEQLLEKLNQSTGCLQKEEFLRESEVAFKQAGLSEDKETGNLDFLKKRDNHNSKTSKSKKKEIDVSKLSFVDTGNEEADEFLRDFIVNQRWRSPTSKNKKNQIPTYDEVLQNAGLPIEESKRKTCENLLGDDDILDDDDEFLIKVNEMEEKRLADIMSTGPLLTNDSKHVKFRFQEEDKEFIKSYPRHIESSIHQAKGEKSNRTLKREARAERKKKAKQARIEELNRLRSLKLAMLSDKIERIKRSCGPGTSLIGKPKINLPDEESELTTTTTTTIHGADTSATNPIDEMDVAMHLDEDWDPDEHDRFVKRMFDEKYYDDANGDDKRPEFSDDSDLDVPQARAPSDDDDDDEQQDGDDPIPDKKVNGDSESLETRKSGRRRRKKHKHLTDSDDMDFEDIIPGATLDEDIICRFRYRKVTPNDFGLSIEDILTADVKELNSWVPMSRITGYRTQEEEERDLRRYHSNSMQQKKTRVLRSLSKPNATWYPTENPDDDEEKPTKKRKRNRKKKKRNLLDIATDDNKADIPTSSHTTSSMNLEPVQNAKPAVKQKRDGSKSSSQPNKKFKGMFVSDARLEAAGITRKDYYRAMNKEQKVT